MFTSQFSLGRSFGVVRRTNLGISEMGESSTAMRAMEMSLFANLPAVAGVKVARVPQRNNGRERVTLILRAATDVIHERGFEAATMREIADRSRTNIGSLYRFFPTKELVTDALINLYAETFNALWYDLIAKAPMASTEQLNDLLLNLFIDKPERYKALGILLGSRGDGWDRRWRFRVNNIKMITEVLKAHAPWLKRPEAKKIAVIMLYSMRAIMKMTFDPDAPNVPGAAAELRNISRAYLVGRIGPGA
jgi:AcrR family transcriptional regulator